MDEMTRSKVQLQRIADDKLRQDMFAKRKQGLVKKAMELSVLCDCDVGLIIFGPGSSGPGAGGQRLYQYSSVSMDELLERYAAAVAEPHERRRNGELLRHYYELSPDEDGEEDAAVRNGDGGASTSAAAAAAAATMAAVDSIILGGGGRRGDGRDSASGLVKRMRLHSPGLGGPGGAASAPDHLPGQVRPLMGGPALTGLQGPGMAGVGGVLGNGMGPLLPPGTGTPLRRVGAVGGGLPLEGIKAAGFLDKRNYPVSPRSEKAYEEVTAEFDKLTELRSQRGGTGGRQSTPTVLQPLSSTAAAAAAAGAGPFSLAAQQQHLQHFLQQQQLLQQQRQQQQQQQQQGGGAKRFKPLSILVPEIQTHPIIPTNLTPLNPSSASGAGTSATSEHLQAGANGPDPHRTLLQQQPQPSPPFNGGLQQPHPHQQPYQQPGGLPPRPPVGRLAMGSRPPSTQPHGAVSLAIGTGTLQGSRGLPGGTSSPGPMAISPTSAAVGPPYGGANGPGDPGALAAPMELDGGDTGGVAGSSSGGAFALGERRSGGMMPDDGLGSLLAPSAFRTSLDGSAANLLAMPSPPPHGTHALFGALDGGPLSMRSSSHGMLGSLSSLDRGPSLGLGGLGMSLESPGGPMGLDTALRGLGPLDVLEWPSSSPRSSAGNGDGLGSSDGGGGGFPDEGEGEGGTVLDGLIVRGTALSKLAPEAREAAIGPSPDTSGGGGTPVSARARVPLSAFCGAAGVLGAAAFTAALGPAPEAAASASASGSGQANQAETQQHLAARGSVSSHAATGTEAAAGGNAQHEVTTQGPEGSGPGTASSLGLTPELSLNVLGLGGPGAVAAAVQAPPGEQGQGGGPDATMGLEVVGKALALPNAAGAAAGVRNGVEGQDR